MKYVALPNRSFKHEEQIASASVSRFAAPRVFITTKYIIFQSIYTKVREQLFTCGYINFDEIGIKIINILFREITCQNVVLNISAIFFGPHLSILRNVSSRCLRICAYWQIRKIVGCACARNTGNASPTPRISDPYMNHGTCATYVPRCMPVSLTTGFLWRWCREKKRSRHSRRMRNPQFNVSGKRPICLKKPGEVMKWGVAYKPYTCRSPRYKQRNLSLYLRMA